jgi:cell division protein FtsX
MQQSETHAMVMLRQKIKEKYSAVKTPSIIIYAQDLANEEKQLDDLFQELLRLSNTSNMNAVDKKHHMKKLKEMYDRHTILKRTRENLIKATNLLIA